MSNEEIANEAIMDSNDNNENNHKGFEEFKEFEKKTLKQIYDEQTFKDVPETKDILGDFVDRVIVRSMYLYNNRYVI